jgi:hypothetical protein
MDVVAPMINEKPARRPAATVVLQAFNNLVACLGSQLGSDCLNAIR